MEDYTIKIIHPTNGASISATACDPVKLVIKKQAHTSEYSISKTILKNSLLVDKFTKEAVDSGFKKKQHIDYIINYILRCLG